MYFLYYVKGLRSASLLYESQKTIREGKIKFSSLLRVKNFDLLLSLLKECFNYHTRFSVVFYTSHAPSPGTAESKLLLKASR